jgi:hypothetical protein
MNNLKKENNSIYNSTKKIDKGINQGCKNITIKYHWKKLKKTVTSGHTSLTMNSP